MSDPTSAQEEAAADAMLDAQIAEHEQEKYEQRMRDEAAIPDDTEPDREPPGHTMKMRHVGNQRWGRWYAFGPTGAGGWSIVVGRVYLAISPWRITIHWWSSH